MACAALRLDRGGWLHVHGNVTSSIKDQKGIVNSKLSESLAGETCLSVSQTKKANMTSPQSTFDDNCGFNGVEQPPSFWKQNHIPSCNKKVKQEWLDWAKYVAQTILAHLRKSHGKQEWNVQVRHIEHVKSYAPHIDHVVLDVECCPSSDY